MHRCFPFAGAIGLAFTTLSLPASAGAPSFACAKADRADERAICRSAALSAQDRVMARDYHAVLHCLGMGSRGAEMDYQSSWLQRRARCGADRACLSRLYRARTAELAPRAAKARRLMARQECPGPV